MNAPIGRSPSPPSTESPRKDESRLPAGDRAQAEAAFERLLRSKTSARKDDDGDSDPSDPAPEDATTAPQAHPLHAFAAHGAELVVPAPAAAAPAVEAPAGGLRATVEAAFGAPIPPAPVAGDNPHTFEVSLRDPLSVPMDLRAVRVPPPLPTSATGSWSLTMSASARDATLLSRHAPRLNERLRTRALDAAHVRVERDAEEDLE